MMQQAGARLAGLAGLTSLWRRTGSLCRGLAGIPDSSRPPKGSQDSASSASGAPGAPPPLPPPPPLPGPQHQPHWLDHYFPGLRTWLEEKNRHWWIKGLIEARCKQYHQLEGREAELRRLIEQEYRAVLARSGGLAVDERAETHLQAAALALASHKTLLPWLRDEAEVLQIIREHMGGRTHALLRFLLRATKDGYAVLSARLRGLQWDMGQAFDTRLELGPAESSLTVTHCFYHDLFAQYGQPQLAACCCCSQDAVWFDATTYRGVEAGRAAAISAGDPCCRFVVRRQAAAPAAGPT